jgi:hypothetical protein
LGNVFRFIDIACGGFRGVVAPQGFQPNSFNALRWHVFGITATSLSVCWCIYLIHASFREAVVTGDAFLGRLSVFAAIS